MLSTTIWLSSNDYKRGVMCLKRALIGRKKSKKVRVIGVLCVVGDLVKKSCRFITAETVVVVAIIQKKIVVQFVKNATGTFTQPTGMVTLTHAYISLLRGDIAKYLQHSIYIPSGNPVDFNSCLRYNTYMNNPEKITVYRLVAITVSSFLWMFRQSTPLGVFLFFSSLELTDNRFVDTK